MTDYTDSILVDLRKRFEQIDRPNVVPDRFHGTTGVVCPLLLEVVTIFTKGRIVGGDTYIPKLSQLMSVSQSLQTTQSHWLVFPDIVCLVKTQHGRDGGRLGDLSRN